MSDSMPASDINDLMAQDPLSLGEQDIRMIVAKFREMRHQFKLGNEQAGSTKAKATKPKASLADKLNLDLGDL